MPAWNPVLNRGPLSSPEMWLLHDVFLFGPCSQMVWFPFKHFIMQTFRTKSMKYKKMEKFYQCRDHTLQLFGRGKQLLDLSWVGQELEILQELEIRCQDCSRLPLLVQPDPHPIFWLDLTRHLAVQPTKLSLLPTSSSHCCDDPTVRIYFYNYFQR